MKTLLQYIMRRGAKLLTKRPDRQTEKPALQTDWEPLIVNMTPNASVLYRSALLLLIKHVHENNVAFIVDPQAEQPETYGVVTGGQVAQAILDKIRNSPEDFPPAPEDQSFSSELEWRAHHFLKDAERIFGISFRTVMLESERPAHAASLHGTLEAAQRPEKRNLYMMRVVRTLH